VCGKLAGAVCEYECRKCHLIGMTEYELVSLRVFDGVMFGVIHGGVF